MPISSILQARKHLDNISMIKRMIKTSIWQTFSSFCSQRPWLQAALVSELGYKRSCLRHIPTCGPGQSNQRSWSNWLSRSNWRKGGGGGIGEAGEGVGRLRGAFGEEQMSTAICRTCLTHISWWTLPRRAQAWPPGSTSMRGGRTSLPAPAWEKVLELQATVKWICKCVLLVTIYEFSGAADAPAQSSWSIC